MMSMQLIIWIFFPLILGILVFPSMVYAQEEHNVNDELSKLLEGENKKSFLSNQKDGSFTGNFGNQEKLESHGNDILIKHGTNVILDRSRLLEYGTILVEGTLNIIETGEEPLRVQKIIVGLTGKLNIGTEKFPIEKNKTVEIIFVKNQPGEIGIFVFGELNVHGYDLGPTFTELFSDALPGQDYIAVTPLVKEWKTESKILITSPGASGEYKHCIEDNEILFIEGPFLHLKKPLECFHQGYNGNDELVSSHVAALDRNIVIRSEDLKNRGSTNFFYESTGYVKFAEFRDLGPKNVLGRYPIHFHHMQDTSRGIEVVGNSIINSDNRWVTIHDSNGILVQNNVGYKSVGHGFFLEQGTEFDNIFDSNIGITTLRGTLIPSDGQTSVFWAINPINFYKNNVAVDGLYYGFHFSISNMLVELPENEEKVKLASVANLEFDKNISYNNVHAGLVIDRYNQANKPNDVQAFTVSKFKVWNEIGKGTGQWGIRTLGQNIIIKDSKIFDSPIGIQLQGKKNLVVNTKVKIINQPSEDPLIAGIIISGEDMTIQQSEVEGYVSNKISSPSDIMIDNDHVREELISGIIIDSTLLDPHPIYFGNPVNSKSFLQIYGYDAPNAPKYNYPKNFILEKIDYENLSQNEKSVDLNFMAVVRSFDGDNDFTNIELPQELEQSFEDLSYEKIQILKNKAIGWNNNIISEDEFSEEIKALIEDGIIEIALLDLDSLETYDLNMPIWMKKTANFWIRDSISDLEFINAIEYVLESDLEGRISSYG